MIPAESKQDRGLFQAGGPLSPTHPAVFAGIYEGNAPTVGLQKGGVRVVCSPKMTGKTTELAFLVDQYARRVNKSIVSVVVDLTDGEHGKSIHDFQQLLAYNAAAGAASTIREVFESSDKFKAVDRRVLTIIGADNLSNEALRWLLHSVRSVSTGAERWLQKGWFIFVDGSFAVDTLAVGPNSDFPLPQLFPREFRAAEQEAFVRDRFRRLGYRFAPGSMERLWKVTWGDKLLTQVLAKRLQEVVGTGHRQKCLTTEAIDCAAAEYASDVSYDEFRTSFLTSCWRIRQANNWTTDDLSALLSFIGARWSDLSVEERASFYRGGAIRRVSETKVALRAPLLLQISACGFQRQERVSRLLRLNVPVEGIADEREVAARKVVRRIARCAFTGTLKTMHAGVARCLERGRVKVNAVTLNGEQYSAVWDIDGGRSINEEAWAVVWVEEPKLGTRTSNLQLFPMASGRA